MGYDLALDLGGTAVTAAVRRGDQVQVCPLPAAGTSASAPAGAFGGAFGGAPGAGSGRTAGLLTGLPTELPALTRLLGEPEPVVLGGVPYSVTALLAGLVRDTVTRASAVEGALPDRLTLIHPITWTDSRRKRLDEVAKLVGRKGVKQLVTPVATATHYAAAGSVPDGAVVATYDLGGTTFEAAVLRRRGEDFEVLGEPAGSDRLGGAGLDDALLQFLDARHDGAVGRLDRSDPDYGRLLAGMRQACAQARQELTAQPETEVVLTLPDRALRTWVSRKDYERIIGGHVQSTVGVLIQVARTAGLSVEDLSAVLLTGGTCRIPMVLRTLTAALRRPVLTGRDLEHAAVLGAAWRSSGRPIAEATGTPAFGLALGALSPYAGPPAARSSRSSGARSRGPFSAGPLAALPLTRRNVLLAGAGAGALLLGGAALALRKSDDDEGGVGGARGGATSGDSAGTPRPGTTVESTHASGKPAGKPSTPRAAVLVPTAAAPLTLPAKPGFVAAAPTGDRLFVTHPAERQISVLDVATGAVAATVGLPAGTPQSLAIAPDGSRAYVGAADAAVGSIVVVDAAGHVAGALKVAAKPSTLAVSPSGRWLFVTHADAGTVSVIDTGTLQLVAQVPAQRAPSGVSFSLDGLRAYVTNRGANQIAVIDSQKSKVLGVIPVDRGPLGLATNPRRPLLANTNYDTSTLTLVSTTRTAVVKRIPVGRNPLQVQWSADGRVAYVANSEPSVSVVDADTGKVTATLPTGATPTAIAVLPDGSRGYVATSGVAGLTVFNLDGS